MPRVVNGIEFRKPSNFATEVARHLREQIISGALAAGERVNETRVTRELQLSRSPVREALRILEAEGLVTLEPHRGAHVRTLSPDELRDIFDVRLMLETHALRAASSRLTADGLAPLQSAAADARVALAAGAMEPWHQASLRLHDGLVRLAGNAHLRRLYDDLKVSLRRYQVSLIGLPQRPQRSQAEHEAILAALESGDVDGAVAEVTAHITGLRERLLERRIAE
jgi:DNA-binding GntR family transcriptional regulator